MENIKRPSIVPIMLFFMQLERLILDGFDASKYSSVIAHFNQYYVHTGDFKRNTYNIINSAYRIREKCDYSDFFVVSKSDAEEQLEKAAQFLKEVREYLQKEKKI